MIFECTDIEGVVLVKPDRFPDERGYFARTWGEDVFAAHGLSTRVAQRNLSYNTEAGTLRGMHYQRPPHSEIKLVSCLVGSIFDVAIDLRPESPTFCRWVGVELRADEGTMLYIPEGCAHGYLTLTPDTLIEYLVSEFYHPEAAAGVRWDDPQFGVQWPASPQIIAERDRTYPDFAREVSTFG
jgi:dTDP-4-dehydrorhamnose 3,5-epimerase